MRIAIDCRWMTDDTGGIRQYTSGLLAGLAAKDNLNEYLLLSDSAAARDLIRSSINGKSNFSTAEVGFGQFSPFNITLGNILKEKKVDLFHSPSYLLPFSGVKKIMTVHDLIPVLYPHYCPASVKTRMLPVFKAVLRFNIAAADWVVTDSENSKNDIVSVFPEAKRKTCVVYLGSGRKNLEEPANPEAAGIKERLGIKDRFILYVGRQDPSKNIANLIKAFRIAAIELHGRGEFSLVIAGKRDPRYEQPYDLVKNDTFLAQRVKFAGFIDDSLLAFLYGSCRAFAFPSLYEGFGLPVLEAMSRGCAVLTSNLSSIPEVAGGAALMVDPFNLTETAGALKKLLIDDQLQGSLSLKAKKRAEMFRWENTAAEMLRLYSSAGEDILN